MNKPLRCLRTLSTFQRPFNSRKKEVDDLTELGKELLGSIKVSGPLSLSHYMKSCLIHPKTGYYMKRDVFGTEGDFVTSPEISQVCLSLLSVFMHSSYVGFR
jgi:NADH dehydrogenase [ubiquinone] 1 alpha subcomplex assembly factor 7